MFMGLIKNEFIKLFSKKKTYIILLLFVVLCGIFVASNESSENNYLKSKDPKYRVENIKEQLQFQEDNLKDIKNNSSMSSEEKEREISNIKATITSMEADLAKELTALENIDTYNWREDVENQITELKGMAALDTNADSKARYEKDMTRLQMHLDKNIPLEEEYLNNGINYLVLNITTVAAGFLAFGLILFNADNVSNEYNPGTLKFLLIQPVTRTSVLISKFIVMIISSLELILGTQALFFLEVGIFKGFGSFNRPILIGEEYKYVIDKGERVIKVIAGSGTYVTISEYLVRAIILEVVFIIVLVSFIFMISTISRSSIISMTVAIGCLLGSNIVYMLWATYRRFTHLIFLHFANIEGIIKGTVILETGSLSFTYPVVIVVSLITTILFLAISLMVFRKRDILI